MALATEAWRESFARSVRIQASSFATSGALRSRRTWRRRSAGLPTEARIGRFHQGQRAGSPAPKAGYKTAICLPVTPKSVLAFREASIQTT